MLAATLAHNIYKAGQAIAPRLPRAPQTPLVCLALNRLLSTMLQDGDFDFLNGRTLRIELSDFGVGFDITALQKRFVSGHSQADACIAANSLDLLRISLGKADPDSLFFQRRLRLSGDTELGLTAKNTLDAVELHQLPRALVSGLTQLERWLSLAHTHSQTENASGTGLPGR